MNWIKSRVKLREFIRAVRFWILVFADWFLASLTSMATFSLTHRLRENQGFILVLTRSCSYFLHSSLSTKFCTGLLRLYSSSYYQQKCNILFLLFSRSMYFHMHILSILVLLVLPSRPQARSVRKPQNEAIQNSVKSKDKWYLQNCQHWETVILETKKKKGSNGSRSTRQVAFLSVILKSYWIGQLRAWKTAFQMTTINRDLQAMFTGSWGILIFLINIFMKCFYIFKLFHTERHFCPFTEIYNYSSKNLVIKGTGSSKQGARSAAW